MFTIDDGVLVFLSVVWFPTGDWICRAAVSSEQFAHEVGHVRGERMSK